MSVCVGTRAQILTIWPAAYVGQRHVVTSRFGHYHCAPPECEPDAEATVELVVASVGPRVFVLENLLSEFESAFIVEQGERVVRESLVGQDGGFKSNTRTSSTGWLRRHSSPVLEQVYNRFADVLGIDQGALETSRNAEELQVVRYEKGQQYAPHHDFGDDGTSEARFLTLLLHVSPSESGGATAFPKAAGGRGLQIKPPVGTGILFYNMMKDGNGDDLTLHSGEPVGTGTKWACNLWIWDPHRGRR